MLIPFALGALVGVTICHSLRALCSNYIWLMWMLGLFTILIINRCVKRQYVHTLSVGIAGAILGFSWTTLKAESILAWTLPTEDMQKLITVKIKIANLSALNNTLLHIDADLIEYHHQIIQKNTPLVRLYWPKPTIKLQPGDLLVCQVKLKRPWRYANPGGIDTEKHFFIQNIRAVGALVHVLSHQRTQSNLGRIRLYLCEKLNVLLEHNLFKGIIIATTLGFNQYISTEQWEVFQNTGTVHAIAISGAHISAVALMCSLMVTWIVRRLHGLSLWMPAQHYGAFCGFLAAILYAAISGYSIPTQRAFIMAWAAWLALIKRQALLTWSGLAIAWLIIGFLYPFATLQTGFWLSFGCVGALIYSRSHSSHRGWHWRRWVMPQCVVFVALLPACAFFFQQIPLLSILANTITVPIMDFLVVPCSLLGLFFSLFSDTFAHWAFKLAESALQVAWWFLEKIAHWPMSVIKTPKVNLVQLWVAIVAVLWLLLPSGLKGRHLAWFAFIPLFYNKPDYIEYGDFKFTLLDVGQGHAAIIHTQNHHLLFDTGPKYGTSSAGNQVIMPYLRYFQINQLDKVIISHSDLDHRGGLFDLRVDILDLITSDVTIHPKARLCVPGEYWQWDGIEFKVLNGPSLNYKDKNNASCVLKISNQYHSVLLTGDIEKKAEQKMLTLPSEVLRSTILVAPHHGSQTSSSMGFIRTILPAYVLFPVGFLNRYQFPHQAVYERYQSSVRLNTWQTGALLFHIQRKQELTPPIRWRDTDYHYWNSSYQEDKR